MQLFTITSRRNETGDRVPRIEAGIRLVPPANCVLSIGRYRILSASTDLLRLTNVLLVRRNNGIITVLRASIEKKSGLLVPERESDEHLAMALIDIAEPECPQVRFDVPDARLIGRFSTDVFGSHTEQLVADFEANGESVTAYRSSRKHHWFGEELPHDECRIGFD